MSDTTANPYLFFAGNAREALDFYRDVLGGDLDVTTFGDNDMGSDERPADYVMHASLMGGIMDLMASDGPGAKAESAKIVLCLGGTDEAKLTAVFEALKDGASEVYGLKQEFWGDTFETLRDKFGIDWMVSISPPQKG